MLRKVCIFTFVSILILVNIGCQKTESVQSQQPNNDTFKTIDQTKLDRDISESTQEDNKNKIIKVTRKDAGLDTIVKKDFSNFLLNQRVTELLLEGAKYTDEDHFKGIIYDSGVFIICNRFDGKVIDEITVKTSIKEAIDILGEPSFKDEFGVYYKTKEYYLALIGGDLIEIMAFLKSPNTSDYDKDILSQILSRLETDDAETVLIDKMNNEEISNFFDGCSHIHGGGWYYTSANGIYINQFFDDNYISIYNNFEGELYNILVDKPIFPISFDNSDCLVNETKMIIKNYLYINERFNEVGILSPGGKRKLLYKWINSEQTYFEIRTLDNTQPDCFFWAMADNYHWLSDDHIIYIDFLDSMPYVFNVNKTEDAYVRVLEEECSLIEVSDGKVVLETKNEEKNKIIIDYTIDDDGKITFRKAN